MTNLKHIEQLNFNKEPILNALKKFSNNKDFLFNFLNNKENIKEMNVGTRKQWGGMHFRTVTYSGNLTFKEYDAPKGFYVSFNSYGNENGELCVSLRDDLIQYWCQIPTNNKYVLFVTKEKIYFLPIKNIINYYLKNRKQVLKRDRQYPCALIPMNDQTVEFSCNVDFSKYTGAFDIIYYKPEYIGNFTYSSYRSRTPVKVFLFDKEGNFVTEKVYRSIHELYDNLVRCKAWSQSEKTLQRIVASEENRFLETLNQFIIATTDLNKKAEDFDVKVTRVIDETRENPFFIKDEPENEIDNPRVIIVKDHYVLQNKTKKDYKEHFKNINEAVLHNDDVEQNIQDLNIEPPKEYLESQIFGDAFGGKDISSIYFDKQETVDF
jgi:hypothetical protein